MLKSVLFKHVPAYLYMMNWTDFFIFYFIMMIFLDDCYLFFPVTEIHKTLWTKMLWTWVTITKMWLPQQSNINGSTTGYILSYTIRVLSAGAAIAFH